MNTIRDCKGCSQKVGVTNEEIEKAIRKVAMVTTTKFIDDQTYEKRLEQCKACNYLEYNTTCLQCGCIVQIRAKLEDSRCPYPKNPRW